MKSLLVHVDGTARTRLRLQIARDLAAAHDAHVTALFAAASPLLDVPLSYAGDAGSFQLLQEVVAGWRTAAQASVNAASPGPAPGWAELSDVSPVSGFAAQMLCADLAILGQQDPNEKERQVPPDFVASVLIESGRPALVIPYAGRFEKIGGTAIVAWKASPASARAVAGALPLLRRARQVTVLEWGRTRHGCEGEALNIERYLQWHGVPATLQHSPVEPDQLGEMLLSRTADLGADLLVMGCYGHSRAREWVLGGATRTVLESMTLPVLMSH